MSVGAVVRRWGRALSGVDRAAGARYVFDRWRELTVAETPWWARPEGLGLRGRLSELLAVVEAERAGGVRWESVTRLIGDAVEAFTGEGSYAAEHLKEPSDQVSRLFKADAPNRFAPGSRAYSAAEGILDQLNGTDYRERLLENLDNAAAAAGWHEKRLGTLTTLVELFDAELVGDGHSAAWRREAAEAANTLWTSGGKTVAEAIAEAMKNAGHDEGLRPFTVVVPAVVGQRPAGGPSALTLTDHGATEPLITNWAAADTAQLVGDPLLVDHDDFYVDDFDAVDAQVAASLAYERFRSAAGLWALREGEIRDVGRAFVYDARLRRAGIYSLPPDRLRLTPDGIDAYDPTTAQVPRLDEALAQLAEARDAPPRTAIVDLWMAVEALFGGTEADPSYDAGNTMADLGEYCLARESLLWLAARLEEVGYGNAPIGGELAWITNALMTDAAQVVEAFKTGLRPLEWTRVQTIMRWEPGSGYRHHSATASARLRQVNHRSYLIRNSLVHAAELNTNTLDITLPTFADLTRVAIGYVIRTDDARGALTAAKSAILEARWVGEAWTAKTLTGAVGLPRLMR
jgi:hypothetical protein